VPQLHTMFLFAGAALLLLITPGPAVLFAVTRSVQQGRPGGLVSVLGLAAGGLVHVTAATFGLSAVIASSARAFTTIKLAGAAYLIFLGIKALRSRSGSRWDVASAPRLTLRRQFVDGFVVNVTNPKTAIFFLAFLPQFVNPAIAPVRTQLAILGLFYVAMALVTDGTYALAAASGRSWLMRNQRLLRYEPQASAAIYFGLGITAALVGRKSA
jgi:threonine/homoserine/homoserine lactone efflux protein